MNHNSNWHGTTIVLIRKDKDVGVAGDGQVSLGNTVIKSTAKKVRKIDKRNVIAGFAGSTADAFTLFERLEALMAIADKEKSFIISGTGDVLEPEEGIIGIGSGGNYAIAAAKVLMDSKMSAEEIAKKSIQVASEICVFTNNNITLEKI